MQVALDVLEVRHREQAQMGEVEAGHPAGFGRVHLERAWSPHAVPTKHTRGRPRTPPTARRRSGAGQRTEIAAVVVPVATGRGQDRRCVSSHVETIGGRHRGAAARAGFQLSRASWARAATGSTWAAVRNGLRLVSRFVLEIVPVADAADGARASRSAVDVDGRASTGSGASMWCVCTRRHRRGRRRARHWCSIRSTGGTSGSGSRGPGPVDSRRDRHDPGPVARGAGRSARCRRRARGPVAGQRPVQRRRQAAGQQPRGGSSAGTAVPPS